MNEIDRADDPWLVASLDQTIATQMTGARRLILVAPGTNQRFEWTEQPVRA